MTETNESQPESPETAETAAETPAVESAEAPPEAQSDAIEANEGDTDASKDTAEDGTDDDAVGAKKSSRSKAENAPKVHIAAELKRLTDLSTKYPEIGPAVAEIAFKTGFRDLGERVVNMGLTDKTHGVEYFFVAANLARRENRPTDAIQTVRKALALFSEAGNEPSAEDADRLLHLVRIGFASLLFDLDGMDDEPEFVDSVREQLPKLQSFYNEDAFYHTLLAQALWFSDKEASEAMWDKAATFGESESTWNARGTWYKEAEKDLGRAEGAYRGGLKDAPESALLLHNLAQVLLDRADQATEEEAETASNWIREADQLLRRAVRAVTRRGLRRHIHSTIDRLKAMRANTRQQEQKDRKPPEVGDIVRGRVRSITTYGAFLAIGGGQSGLLHKSEMAHERVNDPGQILKVGDQLEVKVVEVKQRDDGDGLRIGLSRKAVLPAPEKPVRDEAPRQKRGGNRNNGGGGGGGGNRNSNRSGGGGNRNSNRSSNPRDKKKEESLATLGELLLAKLQDKEESKK